LCDELAQHDIFAKMIVNKSIRVYIKDSDSICNLFALVGENQSLYELNDKIALRSVRNASNRRRNCDTGNINRQITAAAAQVAAIEGLRARGAFGTLPHELKTAAAARLENPDATYDELAEILGLTKSGVVHRLRRVVETANIM